MKDSRKNHLRNAARQVREVISPSNYWRMTGDEKWIYFENPKRKRSWVTPGEPSTSTASQIAMDGRQCSVFGIKKVIYYKLLKSGEIINTERYRQQMINLNQALYEKRLEYQKRQHKVILLHDNAPSHTKLVKETIEAFDWVILSHAAYSPDLAPITTYLHRWDMHLFSSASLLTKMYENGYMTGLAQKSNNFFGVASTNCQTGGKNV